MLGRKLILGPLLVAAAGLPYLASHPGDKSDKGRPDDGPPLAEHSSARPRGDAGEIIVDSNVDDWVMPDMTVTTQEAFQMEISPSWIFDRWQRVSTVLAHLDLQGYRVVLVTGTRPQDLAGSLTYYFDKQNQVQEITFQGTTGDPTELVYHLQTNFDFEQAASPEAGTLMYIVRYHGAPISELRIRPARVVHGSDSRHRFEVSLAMGRKSQRSTVEELFKGKRQGVGLDYWLPWANQPPRRVGRAESAPAKRDNEQGIEDENW